MLIAMDHLIYITIFIPVLLLYYFWRVTAVAHWSFKLKLVLMHGPWSASPALEIVCILYNNHLPIWCANVVSISHTFPPHFNNMVISVSINKDVQQARLYPASSLVWHFSGDGLTPTWIARRRVCEPLQFVESFMTTTLTSALAPIRLRYDIRYPVLCFWFVFVISNLIFFQIRYFKIEISRSVACFLW